MIPSRFVGERVAHSGACSTCAGEEPFLLLVAGTLGQMWHFHSFGLPSREVLYFPWNIMEEQCAFKFKASYRCHFIMDRPPFPCDILTPSVTCEEVGPSEK